MRALALWSTVLLTAALVVVVAFYLNNTWVQDMIWSDRCGMDLLAPAPAPTQDMWGNCQ